MSDEEELIWDALEEQRYYAAIADESAGESTDEEDLIPEEEKATVEYEVYDKELDDTKPS